MVQNILASGLNLKSLWLAMSEQNNICQQIDIPMTLDTIAPGGRIGLIILASDFNAEQDLRRMLPVDVEVFTNRVLNKNPLTLENLRGMTGDISRAATGILPGAELDVIIYGCTSGTIAIGADQIEQLLHTVRPGIPVTNPVNAALAAFKQLNAHKISILTPYILELNQAMLEHFENQGLDISSMTGLGFEDDIDIAGIPPEILLQVAQQVCDPQADALFISCTSLRLTSVIEKIEQAIGKPVVSSNQAMVWHSLKLIGYTQPVQGMGQLLRSL
jgi:maleate isomerase